jgi:hypothetical protein
MTHEPVVTVVVITFNHEQYVEDALRSILSQKTNFPVEVLISDDCSTDGTRRVIDAVVNAVASPHQVVRRYRDSNLGRRGMNNFVQTISEAKGRFVALLEGDDYWTSSDKLQSQVDLLNANPHVHLAGHRTDHVHAQESNRIEQRPMGFSGVRFYRADEVLRRGNIIHTSSFLFRRDLTGEMLRYLSPFACGDLPLLVYNAIRGPVAVDSTCMSHYRRTGAGLCSTPRNPVMPDIHLSVVERLMELFPEHRDILRQKVAAAQIIKASASLYHGNPAVVSMRLVRAAWRNDPKTVMRRLPTLGKMMLRYALRELLGDRRFK